MDGFDAQVPRWFAVYGFRKVIIFGRLKQQRYNQRSIVMETNEQRGARAALPIIRVVMLAGVVLFGAVAIYLSKSGAISALGHEKIAVLRIAFIVVLGCVGLAMFAFRRKRMQMSSDQDPTAMNIVGWALGESVALFGGVLLILSGDITYFLVGFVMMLVAFVFFPIPHDG